MPHLQGTMRLYMDNFNASFNLVEKSRNGPVVIKRHSPPAPHCDRGMRRERVCSGAMAAPVECRGTSDPVVLLHIISHARSDPASFLPPKPRPIPGTVGLERPSTSPPDRWQKGQGVAGRVPWGRAPRTW